LVLSSATLNFVGCVEPISGYVGFRFTQANLHFVSSIVQCETQQWPILEPSPMVGCDNFNFLDSSMVDIPSFRVVQKHGTLRIFTVWGYLPGANTSCGPSPN
jgi:hypothetical protein